MKSFTLYFIVFLSSIIASNVIARKGKPSSDEEYPIGDPRRCNTTKYGRLEVIPGAGWDNLMNKEMGMVIAVNYSKCRTTDDGKYLIPDNVRAIPIKNSKIDTYAEMIEDWNEYTSTLSKSINVAAGATYYRISISGKFSAEYEAVKNHQYQEQSVTIRVQARYVKYRARIEMDSALDEAFRNRLRRIASILVSNHSDIARYETELLVRDFGTHVLTTMDSGAALVQLNELSSTYVSEGGYTKEQLRASASAMFFHVAHFDSDLSLSTTEEAVTSYKDHRTSSKIMTCGGPVFKPANFTPNDWVDSLQSNLVALDKSGEPIYNVINDATLPDVQRSVVYELYSHVKHAVDNYYEYNSHRGCTDQSAPNFSFQSNVDDGTCNKVTSPFNLGGVFVKCKGSGFKNLCENLEQINTFSNSYGCPVGFTPILLQKGTKYSSRSRRQCSRCWRYFDCCHWETEEARAEYSSYWCAEITKSKDRYYGYLFGGLYTSTNVNVFTQSNSCPLYYRPFRLLYDLTVCLRQVDIEESSSVMVFGGFFSCLTGNPYADEPSPGTNTRKSDRNKIIDITVKYLYACPEGYSKYLAVVDDDCAVYFCLNSGILADLPFPKLQRPPFLKVPESQISDPLDDDFVISSDGKLWTRSETAAIDVPAFMINNRLDYQENENKRIKRSADQIRQIRVSLSSDGIAAISIFATVACILLGTGIIIGLRRRLGGRNKIGKFDKSYRGHDDSSLQGKDEHAIIPLQN